MAHDRRGAIAVAYTQRLGDALLSRSLLPPTVKSYQVDVQPIVAYYSFTLPMLGPWKVSRVERSYTNDSVSKIVDKTRLDRRGKEACDPERAKAGHAATQSGLLISALLPQGLGYHR
jgi:hypothetical protein